MELTVSKMVPNETAHSDLEEMGKILEDMGIKVLVGMVDGPSGEDWRENIMCVEVKDDAINMSFLSKLLACGFILSGSAVHGEDIEF